MLCHTARLNQCCICTIDHLFRHAGATLAKVELCENNRDDSVLTTTVNIKSTAGSRNRAMLAGWLLTWFVLACENTHTGCPERSPRAAHTAMHEVLRRRDVSTTQRIVYMYARNVPSTASQLSPNRKDPIAGIPRLSLGSVFRWFMNTTTRYTCTPAIACLRLLEVCCCYVDPWLGRMLPLHINA